MNLLPLPLHLHTRLAASDWDIHFLAIHVTLANHVIVVTATAADMWCATIEEFVGSRRVFPDAGAAAWARGDADVGVALFVA